MNPSEISVQKFHLKRNSIFPLSDISLTFPFKNGIVMVPLQEGRILKSKGDIGYKFEVQIK